MIFNVQKCHFDTQMFVKNLPTVGGGGGKLIWQKKAWDLSNTPSHTFPRSVTSLPRFAPPPPPPPPPLKNPGYATACDMTRANLM